MAAVQDATVQFVYVPAGQEMPSSPDASTIYFNEAAKELRVGSVLIASVSDLTNYLQNSDIVITGTGDDIVGVSMSGNTLTITKGDAGYMPATNGTATGASITLAAAPTQDMEAATKKYVDDAVGGLTGALIYRGVADSMPSGSTYVIGGETHTAATGDVVVFGNKEYAYNGSQWFELGDESSFALKTTQVIAGSGLTGGGALSSDVTITHAAAGTVGSGTGDVEAAQGDDIFVLQSLVYDGLGHVESAAGADIGSAIDNKITTAIEGLDMAAAVGGAGSLIQSINEADGIVTATAVTMDTTPTANSTNPVTSGGVAAAITAAAVTWTVVGSN